MCTHKRIIIIITTHVYFIAPDRYKSHIYTLLLYYRVGYFARGMSERFVFLGNIFFILFMRVRAGLFDLRIRKSPPSSCNMPCRLQIKYLAEEV